MTDHSPRPPEALMRAIAHDLKPVRPSADPLRLALRMLPFALLVTSLIPLTIGPRYDLPLLGPLLTWGASGAQFVFAIALVWIAAHETSPSGRLPSAVVYGAGIAAAAMVVMVTLLTFSIDPASEPVLRIPPRANEMLRAAPWLMGFACGIGSTVAGGILILLFRWFFRNSLVIRPSVGGALYGAGAGLAINSGWRIACPVSNLWHSLGAHGAAIIATVVLGAMIGRMLGNRRLGVGRRG